MAGASVVEQSVKDDLKVQGAIFAAVLIFGIVFYLLAFHPF